MEKKKPVLSILVPVIPGRFNRLKAIISRMTLNQYLHPNIPFELVLIDGGSTDETPDVVKSVKNIMNIKYIYLPIGKFINAAYPRNVGLRVCEGNIIGHIDIDHWPGEHMIFGMTEPFIEQGLDKIINRGYVLDSSESQYCRANGKQWAENINGPLLQQNNMNKEILEVFKYAKIPGPGVNNTLWMWSVKREYIAILNGYDENYLISYRREDDDLRERLLAQGLTFYDSQNKNFCAIHLWHPAPWREEANNENKKYFVKTCNPVKEIVRNKGKLWGRMIEGSYSIIDGISRNPEEHELWVADNITDFPAYAENPIRKSLNVKDN